MRDEMPVPEVKKKIRESSIIRRNPEEREDADFGNCAMRSWFPKSENENSGTIDNKAQSRRNRGCGLRELRGEELVPEVRK